MSYIKKKDFIALYGEEAWAAHTAKKNEYNRQWRKEHPDYDKQWREEHPDYSKQHYQDNKEYYADYSKQYYQDNKEYYAEYYQENKEQLTEQMKQYRNTQLGRANILKNSYIQTDNEKGFPTDQVVGADWIVENIFNSSCIYCGESDWTKLGCDRIDNTKGHTPDNVVCACEKCNKKRGNKYSVEEFQLIKQNNLASYLQVNRNSFDQKNLGIKNKVDIFATQE